MGLEILKRAQNMTVAQGRRKHLEFGGAPASRGTVLLKRAPKNFFPEMLSTGGARCEKIFPEGNFPAYHTEIVVCDLISTHKRHLLFEFSIYSDISFYKRGTFPHKKGHFSSQKRALLVL